MARAKPAAKKTSKTTKPVANRPAAKKPAAAARERAARKTTAKPSAAKKPAAKTSAKKSSGRKSAARKPAARNPAAPDPARKPAAPKPAARKPAARKPAARKTAARKTAARKPSAPTATLERIARITEVKLAHETSLAGLLWLAPNRLVTAVDGALAFWDLAAERITNQLPADSIRHLSASRDGALAVTGSEEGVVRLWDLANERELCVLGTHDIGPDKERNYVSAVAISADGSVAVSSAYDRTLRVWDLASRALRHAVVLPDMAFGCAASPDGRVAACGGSDHILRFVDCATGAIIRTCEKLDDFISSVSWSPDGKHVASTSDGPQAELWDPATGTLIAKWPVPGQTRECGFFPDGTRLWTTGSDKVSIYDVPSATPRGELIGDKAQWAAVAPDGSGRIAHGGGSGRIHIGTPRRHKLRTLELVTSEESDNGELRMPLMSCAWSADSAKLVAVSEDGFLGAFDTASGKRLWKAGKAYEYGLFAAAIAPSGAFVVTGGNDCETRTWLMTTGKQATKLGGNSTMVNDIAFVDEDRYITTSDDQLVLRDATKGKVLAKSTDDLGGNAIVLSPDRALVFAGGEDCLVRVYDAATLAHVRTFEDGHTGAVRCLAITADGTRLVTGSIDQAVRVWDVASGTCLRTCIGHQGPVRGIALHPDGVRALSASSDNTVRVWNIATGDELGVLEGHRAFVSWIRVSPDGTRAATTSGDGKVIIWDLAALPAADAPRPAPAPDTTALKAIAFSADGAKLYAGTEQGLVRVWDAATRAPLPPLRGGRYEVEGLAVSPDGRYVATAVEQHVYLWTDGEVRNLIEEYGNDTVAFSADSTRLIAGRRRLYAWSLPVADDAEPVRIDPKGSPESIAFTSDLGAVAICDANRLRFVDTATGKARVDQIELGARARLVALANDTTAVVTTDKGLAIVDLPRRKVLRQMKVLDKDGDPYDVEDLVLTRDGKHALLLERLGLVVIDLAAMAIVVDHRFDYADYPIGGVACAPDGTLAASTGRGDVLLYRIA